MAVRELAPCLPRENPFRSSKIDRLRFRGPTLEALFERWQTNGCRGALVGPCGTGKTTLLRSITERLRDRGVPTESWRFRSDGSPSSKEIAACRAKRETGTVVIIDGAEQMRGRWGRRSFRLNDPNLGGVWITSHREGWLPTIYRHRPDLETVLALVEELDPEMHADPETRSRVASLLEAHCGNAREVFYALYRTRAGLAPSGPKLHTNR